MLVVEHRMFADALERLLDPETEIQVVGTAASAQEAVQQCRQKCPDVVLIDLDLGRDGSDATRMVKSVCPDVRIVVITSPQSPDAIGRALEAGAIGHVLKTRKLIDLIGVIRRAAAGDMVISAEDILPVIGKMQQTRSARSQAARAREQLTSRELQILQVFSEGKSTPEVAAALYISPLTVRSHVKSILNKLGVHSTLEAVTFALRHNLIQISQSA